jgi:hypothetical protein
MIPNHIIVQGNPGFRFTINGAGFGPSGTLTIGGKRITTIDRWDDENVRGDMPADAKGAVVLVPSNGGKTWTGVYPHPQVVVTKTTTVETAIAPAPVQ